jgi:hypothetical protein
MRPVGVVPSAPVTPMRRYTLERMSAARRAQAGQFARNVLPIIREVEAAGYSTAYIRRAAGS